MIQRFLLLLFALLLCTGVRAQDEPMVKGTGVSYYQGIPTHTPRARAPEVAFVLDSMAWYGYNRLNDTWLQLGGSGGGQGIDGSSLQNGQGPPSNETGNDGDFYIDTDASRIYGPKNGGVWGNGTLITGPPGPAGPAGAGVTIVGTIPTAADLPSPYTGNIGDMFITEDYGGGYVYNQNQNYTYVGPIRGPTGPQGATGTTGAQGPRGNTGAQGVTGATGPAGPQGSDGNNGATGPAGDDGATGSPGPRGIAGPSGPQGPQGNTGATGSTGAQGDNGAAGATGTTGPQGNTGGQGDQGIPGTDGAAGPRGTDGDDGSTGPAGPQGDTGATGGQGNQGIPGNDGAIGPQGTAGSNGAVGPAGPQGSTGPAGSTGATGPQGSQGNTGPQGDDGPQGVQGDQGAGVTIVGSVPTEAGLPPGYTGDIGDTYIVTNTGDGWTWDGSQFNNVGQIRGPQGPQGDTGTQGIAGNNGATGPQGTAGNDGPTGLTGPEGQQGNPGVRGVQGIPGNDGTTGPQGQAGDDGIDGAAGPAGPQGSTGPQGSPGIPGDDGANGAAGPRGFTGDTGSTGAAGATGTQGNTGPQGDQGIPGTDGSDGPPGPQGNTGSPGADGDDLTPGSDGQFLISYGGIIGWENIGIQLYQSPRTYLVNDLVVRDGIIYRSKNNGSTNPVVTNTLNWEVATDVFWNDIKGIPSGFADGVDNVTDADSSPTNEIQFLTFNTNTNVLSLTDGNSVTINTFPNTGVSFKHTDGSNRFLLGPVGSAMRYRQIVTNSTTAPIWEWANNVNTTVAQVLNDGTIVGSAFQGDGSGLTGININDADSSPTNEIQTLIRNGSTINLSGGGGSFSDNNGYWAQIGTRLRYTNASNAYIDIVSEGKSVFAMGDLGGGTSGAMLLYDEGVVASRIRAVGTSYLDKMTLGGGASNAREFLDVRGNGIFDGLVTAGSFSGDGSLLTNLPTQAADNLGNHTATQALVLDNNIISRTAASDESIRLNDDNVTFTGTFGGNYAVWIFSNYLDMPERTSDFNTSDRGMKVFWRKTTEGGIDRNRMYIHTYEDHLSSSSGDAKTYAFVTEQDFVRRANMRTVDILKTSGSFDNQLRTDIPEAGTYEVHLHLKFQNNVAGGGVLWYVNAANLDVADSHFTRQDQYEVARDWTTNTFLNAPGNVTNTWSVVDYVGQMEFTNATTVNIATGTNGVGNTTYSKGCSITFTKISD